MKFHLMRHKMAFEQQKKMLQKVIHFPRSIFQYQYFFYPFFFWNSKFTINELTTFNVILKNKETTIFSTHSVYSQRPEKDIEMFYLSGATGEKFYCQVFSFQRVEKLFSTVNYFLRLSALGLAPSVHLREMSVMHLPPIAFFLVGKMGFQ